VSVSALIPGYNVDTRILDVYEQPPDILVYLTRRLSRLLKPFPDPSTHFASPDRHSEYGEPKPCAQTLMVVAIFDRLGPVAQPALDRVTDRAAATVQLMVEHGLGPDWLADRPASIALPMLEMMKLCQMMPSRDAAGGVFSLTDRVDLELQMRGGVDLPPQPEHDVSASWPGVG
jgi:hypothetical protein